MCKRALRSAVFFLLSGCAALALPIGFSTITTLQDPLDQNAPSCLVQEGKLPADISRAGAVTAGDVIARIGSPIQLVPEPLTMFLVGSGLVGFAVLSRRLRRKR